MKAFKAYCVKQLDFLDALHENPELSSDPAGTMPAVIVEVVRDKAARLGLSGLVEKMPTDATFDDARRYLAEAIAACAPKDAEPEDSLSVDQVAKLLGCKPKTVRTLVDRTRRGLPGGIRFHQTGRHWPIHIRREWINEFLAEHSHGVKRTGARAKPLTYDEF
jgi:excisionase family DNA binding protein